MIPRQIEIWQQAKAATMPEGVKGFALVAITETGELTWGAHYDVTPHQRQEMATKLRQMAADILSR